MRIRWSGRARTDLQDLRDYIAKDSPYYARRFVAKIIASVEKLRDHPEIGRVVPEAKRDNVRELIFHGYRIVYLLAPEHIFIVTIIHGSRDLTAQEPKPWEII